MNEVFGSKTEETRKKRATKKKSIEFEEIHCSVYPSLLKPFLLDKPQPKKPRKIDRQTDRQR